MFVTLVVSYLAQIEAAHPDHRTTFTCTAHFQHNNARGMSNRDEIIQIAIAEYETEVECT
jgi:hypothetical protein